MSKQSYKTAHDLLQFKGIALLLLTLLCLTLSTGAQDIWLPLHGPLLATSSVSQDSIMLYDVGADQYRELRLGQGAHTVWDFSPDGCRILYTLSDGVWPARLYSARLDGSDQTPLVQFDELPAAQWSIDAPDWSSTGQIAFVLVRTDAEGKRIQHHIAVIEGTGGTPQMMSITGDEYSPFWSPDGTRLAYLAYEKRAAGADVFSTAVPTVAPPPGEKPPPATLISEADLWIINADGSEKYNATQFMVGNVGKPRWSPAGDLLAFEYASSGNNDTVWMIGSQRGAFATQLSSQSTVIMDMTWLTDGTGILGAISFFRDEPQNRLWQIPLVGQAEVGAVRYLDALPLTYADYPRFSPDGHWLAMRSEYRLVLVDVAAQTMSGLDERMSGNTPAVWSPTAFTGEKNCNPTLALPNSVGLYITHKSERG